MTNEEEEYYINSQPEHWCDKHQALFSYHVVYGIRHYVCTLCFVDQPATHPAEGLREPEVDPKCLSASQQDSLEYARGWVGHLDDNPIANDHNNCVIATFVELAQLKRDLQDRDNHIELAYSELGKFNRSIYLFDYIREFKHENNKLAECLELAIDELKDIRNQSGYPYGIEDVLKDIERIKQG